MNRRPQPLGELLPAVLADLAHRHRIEPPTTLTDRTPTMTALATLPGRTEELLEAQVTVAGTIRAHGLFAGCIDLNLESTTAQRWNRESQDFDRPCMPVKVTVCMFSRPDEFLRWADVLPPAEILVAAQARFRKQRGMGVIVTPIIPNPLIDQVAAGLAPVMRELVQEAVAADMAGGRR